MRLNISTFRAGLLFLLAIGGFRVLAAPVESIPVYGLPPYIKLQDLEKVLKPHGGTIRIAQANTTNPFAVMCLSKANCMLLGVDILDDKYVQVEDMIGRIFGDPEGMWSITGWLNPIVQVDNIRFQFGNANHPMSGYSAYSTHASFVCGRRVGLGVIPARFAKIDFSTGQVNYPRTDTDKEHIIEMHGYEGQVFVIVTEDIYKGNLYSIIAPVDAQGKLKFYVPWEQIRFSEATAVRNSTPADSSESSTGSIAKNAVLIQLSGPNAQSACSVVFPSQRISLSSR